MKDEKEIRNVQSRATVDPESRTVEGYALLFNTPSDGLDFSETIDSRALDGTLEASDVLALYNHDEGRGFLARFNRSCKSLKLKKDERGLMYSFEAPNTDLGNELVEHLKRGEITESSFCFSVDDEEWEDMGEGQYKRTIKHIKRLYDVSPVISAAYSKTTVSLRGRDEMIKRSKESLEKENDTYFRIIEKEYL